jgi:hypothetical protein
MAGPNQRSRSSRTGTIPTRDLTAFNDPNWSKTQRQPLLDTPVCITGSNGGAVVTGVNFPILWNIPAPIYDRYNMIGQGSATTMIRIPWDGIYSFEFIVNFVNLQAVELRCVPFLATTSDTGFGAIVFNQMLGPVSGAALGSYLQYTKAAPAIGMRGNFRLFGYELHANDLVQLVLQANAAANQSFNIDYAVFKWDFPIPNNMLTIMPNHV